MEKIEPAPISLWPVKDRHCVSALGFCQFAPEAIMPLIVLGIGHYVVNVIVNAK